MDDNFPLSNVKTNFTLDSDPCILILLFTWCLFVSIYILYIIFLFFSYNSYILLILYYILNIL